MGRAGGWRVCASALGSVSLAVCAVAVAGTTASSGPAADGLGAGAAARIAQQETTVQLTQWRRIARWAHAIRPARVRAKPSLSGRPITKLHFRTEDGFPEVYLVLTRHVAKDGKTWLKIAVPMKPNGTTGWVLRGGLGRIRAVRTWLIIDRTRLRAQFFERGRLLWKGAVGIGAPATPTPRGLFWVREQFELPDQVFYGPYAFGTSAYANVSDWPGGGVVGLHGTSLPHLIPGHPSHGCIRLRNQDIVWLAYHMPNGTPVAIIN